jgi:hypothetical protein
MDVRTRLVTVFLILTLAACDAGLSYAPRDWAFDGRYWRHTYGPAEFRAEAIGDLAGAKFAGLQVRIENHSGSESITVRRVTLKTGRAEYPGQIRIGKIGPGQAAGGIFLWKFEEPISAIFSEPMRLLIILRIGQKDESLNIHLTRFP